jgi:hypothetical protein
MQMFKQPLLILVAFFFCPLLAGAQDNNLLAKLAYENAETALTEKKFLEGVSELRKVDELLGKLTPKSQFLRVQLWMAAAEISPVYLDSAIVHSKKYLALSKSFEIPEEKQMETLRQLQKMEKDKAVYDKKAKEVEAANAMLQSVEKAAETHDAARVAVLAGLDLDKDALEQITKTERLAKKDVNYWKKHQTPITISYVHKGKFYSIPVNMYSNLSKRGSYQINGLETDMLVRSYFTTADGDFQELEIVLIKTVPDIETYVNQISAILGFKPDAQLVVDPSRDDYSSWVFWSFKNYSVSLLKYSDGMAKAMGYEYLLSIVRHDPNKASPLYYPQLAPWK